MSEIDEVLPKPVTAPLRTLQDDAEALLRRAVVAGQQHGTYTGKLLRPADAGTVSMLRDLVAQASACAAPGSVTGYAIQYKAVSGAWRFWRENIPQDANPRDELSRARDTRPGTEFRLTETVIVTYALDW